MGATFNPQVRVCPADLDLYLTVEQVRGKRAGRRGATMLRLIFAGWLPQVGVRLETLPLSSGGRRPLLACP